MSVDDGSSCHSFDVGFNSSSAGVFMRMMLSPYPDAQKMSMAISVCQ